MSVRQTIALFQRQLSENVLSDAAWSAYYRISRALRQHLQLKPNCTLVRPTE